MKISFNVDKSCLHGRHAERLATEAAEKAARAEEWLLPSEPGTLEAEGMERTWRFKQARFLAKVSRKRIISLHQSNHIRVG